MEDEKSTTQALPTRLTARDVAAETGSKPVTVYAWNKRGVRGPDGTRHFLRGIKVGGLLRFERADVEAFFAAINGVEEAVDA